MQTPTMAPCSSALEALVWQPIIHQVADAVHRVLEEGGGGEHEHPDGWIDEGDDVEGGNESGEFADVGEVFERFHGDRGFCVNVQAAVRQSPIYRCRAGRDEEALPSGRTITLREKLNTI